MEILIVGSIIVALMVYASTRIKRSAAAAYDAESIIGDRFKIQKPEGFLHNLNGDAAYVFEAYSKGFSEEHPKVRVGTARIKAIPHSSVDSIGKELASRGDVIEDSTEVLDGITYRILSVDETGHDVPIRKVHKLAAAAETVYRLEVASLDTDPEPAWAKTFIDSFRVK